MIKSVNVKTGEKTEREQTSKEISDMEEARLRDAPSSFDLWLQNMNNSDIDMPRWAVDIIDALDFKTRDRIDPITLDRYNAKKLLISQKPEA